MLSIPHVKRVIFSCLIFIVFAASLIAQGGVHLRKYITELDTAKNLDELKKAEQNFFKLIQEGKRVRQAYYYAALGNILIAFKSNPKDVDEYCSKAENYLKKLDSIAPDNSEIMVLFAMDAAAKINTDPARRLAKFGAAANKYSDRALVLNDNNPRAHLIKARTVMNTPPKLGGGPKFALKHYEKAVQRYKTFEPLSDTEPNWGEAMAKKELEECKEKLKSK